jgi:hypothetical protein
MLAAWGETSLDYSLKYSYRCCIQIWVLYMLNKRGRVREVDMTFGLKKEGQSQTVELVLASTTVIGNPRWPTLPAADLRGVRSSSSRFMPVTKLHHA